MVPAELSQCVWRTAHQQDGQGLAQQAKSRGHLAVKHCYGLPAAKKLNFGKQRWRRERKKLLLQVLSIPGYKKGSDAKPTTVLERCFFLSCVQKGTRGLPQVTYSLPTLPAATPA